MNMDLHRKLLEQFQPKLSAKESNLYRFFETLNFTMYRVWDKCVHLYRRKLTAAENDTHTYLFTFGKR